MKRSAILVYCLLIFGCKESSIKPAAERNNAIIQFNKKEITFSQFFILPKMNNGSREYLFSSSYTEKKMDSTRSNSPLRYSTSIIFREDTASRKYTVTQVNFDIAAFLDERRINYNSFSTVSPESNVSFHFTTNKIGKVTGTFEGKLKNWDSFIIPEINNKDSTLEVSGQFDLNFDPVSPLMCIMV
jgi:hypothetical protein